MYIQGIPQISVISVFQPLKRVIKGFWQTFIFNGVVEHTSCSKITPLNKYGTYTYTCMYSNTLSISTNPQITKKINHIFLQYILLFPILWPKYGKEKYVLQQNINSPVLIVEFLEMDKALLYVHRIGLKVKEWF